ncbi:LptF/LptG family permease, partial [Roseisolibacter sp. H3M3-2]|uniref:LptF/LptG family permease n=1 Tax=Roseisolibacter sp. H3M3-2 TaxID=3031323 RepID=UPI0023D97E0F
LFAHEVARARSRGAARGAAAGAAGLGDLLRRGAYERVRARPDAVPATRPPGATMPPATTRALLRRHAGAFAVACATFTAAMVGLFAWRQVPGLAADGASPGTIVEAMLLAVPFTAAMTIPIAVLVAVLYATPRAGDGARGLLAPLLAAAVGIAALELGVTAVAVPHANARLAAMLSPDDAAPNDRAMTIAELRAAARAAPEDAAGYEVEVQKKLALPGACVVLALAGLAIARRAPRGGTALVVGASVAVTVAYYLLMVTGEGLADRLVVTPAVGMWGANAVVLAAAALALWRRPARLLPADA